MSQIKSISKMKYTYLVLSILILATSCSSDKSSQHIEGFDPMIYRASERVETLLSSMTLEEKIGEMTQITLEFMCQNNDEGERIEPHTLDSSKVSKVINDFKVGSILNCAGHSYSPEHWQELIAYIQKESIKSKGIPILYGVDAIHGATYTKGAPLGPQQIALAATWDTSIVRSLSTETAKEVWGCGIPWNFSPVLDMGRDPRWPRFWETFGEDVKLVSDMGKSMVKGYQEGPMPFAATLKHFLGYSTPWSGKDRTPAYIPERQLREIFLPPFQKSVDAGALSVMINSGEINGIPTHINKFILTDLLRGEMGFEGVAVTDWEDIKYLFTRHKVAENYKDAIKLAIDAGIDMSMVPLDLTFPKLLKELVDEGLISEERINLSVRRILTMKEKLGLLETDVDITPPFIEEMERNNAEELTLLAAKECITLLKNNNDVLPLSDDKILVTGPTSNSQNALNGGWSGTWQGDNPAFNNPGRLTPLAALRQSISQVDFFDLKSMSFSSSDINNLISKIEKTKPSTVILFLGEMPYTEVVGNIDDLTLPENQLDLVRAVKSTGVNTIGVFIEGRPRTFDKIEPLLDGIIMAYLPGEFGGVAISEVLTGAFNPCGRLPFTWPKNPSSHVTYDRKYTENVHSDFSMNAFDPQYEFGFGLNYSPVITNSIRLNGGNQFYLGDEISVEVELENIGERTSTEVVMLFSQDVVASITPSVDKLKAYQRVSLEPGEVKNVTLRVSSNDLGFINQNLNYVVEPGLFNLRVKDKYASISIIN